MLKQTQLEKGYLLALKDCFSKIPKGEINLEMDRDPGNADAQVLLKINNKEKQLFIMLKSLGTPLRTRDAVNQLLVILNKSPNAYGIVIAPYISSRSAEICKENDVGYVDLSGNFWIAFDSIFLSQENMPNQYPVETSLSNIYAPKSERVLRVLLTYPYSNWKTTELSEEADISLGMITHIRRRLEEEEWAQQQDVGFYLSDPIALLDAWVGVYNFQKHDRYDFYTMESLPEIEKRIDEICKETKTVFAITGFSAANWLAPIVKSQKSMIYLSQDIKEIANQASLKAVETGANITLIKPYDEGVFWNRSKYEGVQVATPIQVYLDLRKMRGRGDEAAEFLFTEVINKSWQHQKNNMNRS